MAWSGGKDIVDQIFDAGYWLVSKSAVLSDEIKNHVEKSIESISGKISNKETPRLQENDSNRSKVYKTLRIGLQDHWKLGLGISATSLCLYLGYRTFFKLPPNLSEAESQVVLILGDMNDPIIRNQVMDLYRRRFTVYICTENADVYKKHEEDQDFIYYIDPTCEKDFEGFFVDVPRLASILFMPRLSYHPSGVISCDSLESEIHSSIFVYYQALLSIIPHLKRKTQLIMFNPSLTADLNLVHHSTEIITSGIIDSLFKIFKEYQRLNVSTIKLGILQIGSQPSNYKFLRMAGSDIHEALHYPVYKMIMSANGYKLRQLLSWLTTLGGYNSVYYCGRFSYLVSWPFASLIFNHHTRLSLKRLRGRLAKVYSSIISFFCRSSSKSSK
ncbi:CGH_1_collapsed_G0019060.mRNA.1.CDS.1 [Saccharomyces cerevisiae]|nr:CGH_1_collapsed_G0019060.mRNA.1.CDS.1 [Saccharomyces cerevisiae]